MVHSLFRDFKFYRENFFPSSLMVPKKCTVVKVSFQNAKSRRAHIGVLGAIHMSCHTGGEGWGLTIL